MYGFGHDLDMILANLKKIIEILKISILRFFFSTSTRNIKQVPERYGHDSGSLQEHKLTQRYTFEALQPREINGFQGVPRMNIFWSKINGFRSES